MRGRIMRGRVRAHVENRNKTGKNDPKWLKTGTEEGIL